MKTIPFHSARGCLSYLLVAENEGALIDPSEEIPLKQYLHTLTEHGTTLRYVIETHTHADHISSAPAIVAATGAKLVRHTRAPSPRVDIAVEGGEELPLGTSRIHILATPGHTNESISVHAGAAVFTGDALLIGGTGRTDFQLGDSAALYTSLHEVFGKLPDETIVYPAHDYHNRTSSTIGQERAHNPRFLLPREEFVATLNAHHPPLPELFEKAISINSR